MNKTELISKLSDLEWEDFEVKAARGELPKSSWETVSAFSNTTGGWLVYGIRQSGKSFVIKGLSNPEKIEQDFLNAIRSGKFNVFIPTQQMKYDVKGKKVIAFYIPVSAKKPVYFNTLSNTYIRRGSSDQKATKEEIDAMFRDQTFGTKTSELVSGTSDKDIDQASLQEYREYMSRFNPDVSYNRYKSEEFLTKLRIIDSETGLLTYAGLLFLGTRLSIEKYIPDFRIDLLEIPGTSYADATSRYTFRLNEDGYNNLWQAYFECYNRLRNQVKVDFQMSPEGFGEELSPGLKTLREALVNMLMHTDYFSPAHPRIRVFRDRIEFYNPGGLPKPLEELKAKDLSIPRNPILAKLFRMVKLAENAGYGFDKMESNWKKYMDSDVAYEISFDSTILVFPLANEQNKELYGRVQDSYFQNDEKENAGRSNKYYEIKLDKLRADFGPISDRLEDSLKKNLYLLQRNQKLMEDYFRDVYGILTDDIEAGIGAREVYILILMMLYPSITALQLAAIINVSESSIRRSVRVLTQSNIIRRIGSDKTGKWYIEKMDKG